MQADAKGEALLGVPDKGVDHVQDVQVLHKGGNGALASILGLVHYVQVSIFHACALGVAGRVGVLK
jgi:hypothetical protein